MLREILSDSWDEIWGMLAVIMSAKLLRDNIKPFQTPMLASYAGCMHWPDRGGVSSIVTSWRIQGFGRLRRLRECQDMKSRVLFKSYEYPIEQKDSVHKEKLQFQFENTVNIVATYSQRSLFILRLHNIQFVCLCSFSTIYQGNVVWEGRSTCSCPPGRHQGERWKLPACPGSTPGSPPGWDCLQHLLRRETPRSVPVTADDIWGKCRNNNTDNKKCKCPGQALWVMVNILRTKSAHSCILCVKEMG